jgi:gamma-butyrobetaine dioxygenase
MFGYIEFFSRTARTWHRLETRRWLASMRLQLKSSNETHAVLTINNNDVKYDWIFLRDSCQCHQCVDVSTQQKRFHTADIPMNISPLSTDTIRIWNESDLEIFWNQSLNNENETDHHRSLYSVQWLHTYASYERIARARYHDRPSLTWNRFDLEKIDLYCRYHDYLHSDDEFYRVLKLLNDYGLAFIDHVQGERAVERITERIGDIRRTFYGQSWDVKSVEQAVNIAYTSQALDLHMDLLYFEAPPGLQFLHALANSVQGGASYFVDSFRAAEQLRQIDRDAFDILCSYPVTFHYRNAGRHYHFTRSTIVLDRYSPSARIDHVNYSPPFQAPFEFHNCSTNFRRFLHALKQFRSLIEHAEHRFELILEKDQCVIFHNRRILHARRAFDATSGDRWLKGCYTDLDNFNDRWRIFRERFEPFVHRTQHD